METIGKHLKSLKEAERYQNRLYNQFDYVRLVSYPLFSEEGDYIWNVK